MRAKNLHDAAQWMGMGWDFTGTNVTAKSITPKTLMYGAYQGFGKMPTEARAQLVTALSDLAGMSRNSSVYIVYSYGTPIGWVTSDNEVVIPDVTYSRTTSRHQNMVRLHLRRRQQ